MLTFISWGRFGAVVFIGLAVYYGYVVVRFYGRDLRRFAGARGEDRNRVNDSVGEAEKERDGEQNATENSAEGSEVGEGKKRVEESAERQTQLYPHEGSGETPEMFKVMQKVIIILRQVVAEAAGTGITREELEERIGSVLGGYGQLMKTPYEVAINNFISRTCTTTFSLLLSDAEIEALWG